MEWTSLFDYLKEQNLMNLILQVHTPECCVSCPQSRGKHSHRGRLSNTGKGPIH